MNWYRRLSPLQQTVFFFSLFVVLGSLFLPPPAQADDCMSDPLNAADCMRTPGYRQTITIIFTGLPTLAVVLPNLLGNGQKTTAPGSDQPPDKKPDEQPTIRYVVQVSAPRVLVEPNKAQALAIRAYKSVDGAPWAPAPEVQLNVSMSPESQDLSVSPRAGMGEIQVILRGAEQMTSGERRLTVTGTAPAARTSADVIVEVKADQYELRTSSNRLEVAVGDSVELEVSTWRVDEQGMMVEEPNARIRPWLPSEKDFFEWSPPPPYTKGNNEIFGGS